jgi:hypothetical protein
MRIARINWLANPYPLSPLALTTDLFEELKGKNRN